MVKKWRAFGWDSFEIDGHNKKEFKKYINRKNILKQKNPTAIVLNTTKGKGIKLIEGHGPWHHKIPNLEEVEMLKKEIDKYVW